MLSVSPKHGEQKMMNPPDNPPTELCVVAEYNELSARNALARRRSRGETYWVMFHCTRTGVPHWHVYDTRRDVPEAKTETP